MRISANMPNPHVSLHEGLGMLVSEGGQILLPQQWPNLNQVQFLLVTGAVSAFYSHRVFHLLISDRLILPPAAHLSHTSTALRASFAIYLLDKCC